MRLSYKSNILTEGIADGLIRRGWDAFPSTDPGRDLVLGKADLVLGPAIDYSRHLGAVDYALVIDWSGIRKADVKTKFDVVTLLIVSPFRYSMYNKFPGCC